MKQAIFSGLWPIIILSLAYFAAGKLGLSLAFVNDNATAIWPPTGIALAACLLLGYRVWPGITLGAFLVNITTSGSVPASAAIAVGNTLEGLAGAYLVNRFANGIYVFDRAQDIFKFAFLAAILSTMISATFGTTSLALGGLADWANYLPVWVTWWLGDVAGAIIVTPVIVTWAVNSRISWVRERILEALALFFAVISISIGEFGGLFFFSTANYPLGFAILPLIVWSAFRFAQRGIATTTFFLMGIAIWGTLQGFGPFYRENRNEALLLLQAFMSTVAITGLCLAALVSRSHQAEEAVRLSRDQLQQLNAELEQRINERTVQLRASNAQLRNEVAERQQAQHQLEESRTQLRRLSAYLQAAREEERARLAREIHDELGQTLTALKVVFFGLQRSLDSSTIPNQARLLDMSQLIDGIAYSVRRITTELRPIILDDLGLVAAIERQLDEFQSRSGIGCKLVSNLDETILDAEGKTVLFRIFQEALTNVMRHANATSVVVNLEKSSRCLTFQVQDNGCGITESDIAKPDSFGLLGMRERVHLLNGDIDIYGVPSQGTTIVVRFSLGQSPAFKRASCNISDTGETPD